MQPLYEVLKGKPDMSKAALIDAAVLVHPLPDTPVAQTTDTSDFAVGALF